MASSNAAFAAISTPPGLAAGDHFRIVFTAITHAPATSTDIGTYDASVSARATAGGLNIYNGNPVTWQAIGSTATVSAISRLPISSAPLFLPTGIQIAANGSDLWDGSLIAPINQDEFSNTFAFYFVFTGSDSAGGILEPLGGTLVRFGLAGNTTSLG